MLKCVHKFMVLEQGNGDDTDRNLCSQAHGSEPKDNGHFCHAADAVKVYLSMAIRHNLDLNYAGSPSVGSRDTVKLSLL